MKYELRLNVDQHLLDRMEALWLLYQESSPAPPPDREDLLQAVLEEGLRRLLQDQLVTPRSVRLIRGQRQGLVATQVA